MKEVIKKEILYDLTKTIEILQVKEAGDMEKLRELSDHAIEDVALHKDLDLISLTVLIYSLYKITNCMSSEDYQQILKYLQRARASLQQGDLGKYNRNIKKIFNLTRTCNAKVKEHLDDVMHAARIKKGSTLLEKGLSIGQAAGLMGLSNWDLQQYIGKTGIFEQSHEAIPAAKRVQITLQIFGVD